MRMIADIQAGTITVDDGSHNTPGDLVGHTVVVGEMPKVKAGVARIAWSDEDNTGVIVKGEAGEGGSHSSERFTDRKIIEPFLAVFDIAMRDYKIEQEVQARLQSQERVSIIERPIAQSGPALIIPQFKA